MTDERGAQMSDCGRYRYTLWRRWGPGRVAMFIGLNPSTADAEIDDPTIRRCVGFARSWGYDGLMMCNLFAWRATKPRDMLTVEEPIGPLNNDTLRTACMDAAVVVAAWGVNGRHRGRDWEVRGMLPHLHYLKLSKGGHPYHPLYLPATLRPTEWQECDLPDKAVEP